MPTENELKYVLRLECEPEISAQKVKKCEIKQGYLQAGGGSTLRVRRSKNDEGKKHEFTYKYKFRDRVIEIESEIDKKDFTDLWEDAWCCLRKTRYSFKDGDITWDIDFFKTVGYDLYFVMAESEMPEGMAFPPTIPHIIKKNIVYSVERDDRRFSSRKIADIKSAIKLHTKLTEEKNV